MRQHDAAWLETAEAHVRKEKGGEGRGDRRETPLTPQTHRLMPAPPEILAATRGHRAHADSHETPRCGVPARLELCVCPPNSSGRHGRAKACVRRGGLAPSPAEQMAQHRARSHAQLPQAKWSFTAAHGPAPLADHAAGRSSPALLCRGRLPHFLTQIRPGPRRSRRGSRPAAVASALCRCAPG